MGRANIITQSKSFSSPGTETDGEHMSDLHTFMITRGVLQGVLQEEAEDDNYWATPGVLLEDRIRPEGDVILMTSYKLHAYTNVHILNW